jgi:DNA-binding transcriptional LysR family regulator
MDAIPFSQLTAFLAVARTQSFSAAARELGVSRSAVSLAVRQLEERLDVVVLQRTTRSVALTEVGRRLVEGVGPAFAQTAALLAEVSAKPGEAIGRLRLALPLSALPLVIEPVLPTFRARHPRVEVELVFADRLVDIVADGFDAGIRLTERVERDMVQVRLTERFRFVIVGSPGYFARRGRPESPSDLLDHECVGFRLTNGAPYAWELERGGREWRVPVRSALMANDGLACAALAKLGLGLAYVPEPNVRDELRAGQLEIALEPYAPSVPGYFLFFPSRAQRSTPLRSFVETATAILRDRGTTRRGRANVTQTDE